MSTVYVLITIESSRRHRTETLSGVFTTRAAAEAKGKRFVRSSYAQAAEYEIKRKRVRPTGVK